MRVPLSRRYTCVPWSNSVVWVKEPILLFVSIPYSVVHDPRSCTQHVNHEAMWLKRDPAALLFSLRGNARRVDVLWHRWKTLTPLPEWIWPKQVPLYCLTLKWSAPKKQQEERRHPALGKSNLMDTRLCHELGKRDHDTPRVQHELTRDLSCRTRMGNITVDAAMASGSARPSSLL